MVGYSGYFLGALPFRLLVTKKSRIRKSGIAIMARAVFINHPRREN